MTITHKKNVAVLDDFSTKTFNLYRVLPAKAWDNDLYLKYLLVGINRYMHRYVLDFFSLNCLLLQVLKRKALNLKKSIIHDTNNLINRRSYQELAENQAPSSANILISRFIFLIKNFGTLNEAEKAKFLPQSRINKKEPFITDESVSSKKSPLQIVLMYATTNGYALWSQNVNQGYIQNYTLLQCPIHFIWPKQLGHQLSALFKQMKPLYGIWHFGDYWFQTFRKRFTKTLSLVSLPNDKLLYVSTFVD